MSEQKNLKFIHLGSTAAAKDGSFEAGAIIFEPKSGRIAVQGTTAGPTGLEYYGGGRIADATFDTVGKVLTLSFNDGSDAIKLDFSDTASATGVNAIMKAHADRIKALEGTVGDASKGLVKAVADNKSSIDAINNPTTGILAKAKKDTDDKLTTLKNGYAGTLKDLDDDITALQKLHADKDASSKKTVKEEIDAKVGDIADGITVKKYVDDAVKTVTDDATALTGRVTTLETTVGGHDTKINTLIGKDADKSVRTIASEELAAQLIPAGAKESLDTLQEIAAWIQDHPDDAAAMNGKITALETTVGKAAADGNPATGLVKAVADNAEAIKANAAAITSNDNDIAALQRLHAKDGKTMKTVAQEVAKGIEDLGVTSVASDDEGGVVVTVTTTKGKVSDVVVNASALAGRVDALETSVGTDTDVANADGSVYARIAKNVADIAANASTISANTGKIDGHTTRIEALEGKHAPNKTVKQEVTDGITGISEAIKTAGTDVKVTVKTKSGSVSEVAVDATVLKKAVSDEETRATGVENKLRTDLGTKADGEGDAFTRIKALEKKQADGALMWSVWD